MTNHWADIANTTLVLAWGANPVENHPACIAHINRARFPKQYFKFLADGVMPDPRASKKPAQLIVIDPRKTRTALQCNETDPTKPANERDRYVRIRPGTDIALQNGLLRYMIEKIEALPAGNSVRDGFFAHLNQNGAGTFFTDGNAVAGPTAGSNSVAPIPSATGVGFAGGNSKYTDARFLVNAGGTDYQRDRIVAATGAITAMAKDSTTISDFPLKAATVDADPNTVYNRLKAHVAPYTLPVVANICACSADDIAFIGDAYIAHSKCSNGVTAAGLPSVTDARAAGFRATTILYAMGITQHTCGSQNIKGFANLQTIMGNQGRQGGGINALRGIHNVQGSTDMGLLFGNIPAYSGNPGTQVDGGPVWATTPSTNNAFGKYMDALWGTPLSGTGNKAQMNLSYDDAYNTTAMALQQRGFYNMTLKWFGDYTYVNGLAGAAKRAAVDACYSLWPKGNGHDHVTMFRDMGAGLTKAALVWGQNPAVTEPNQGAIRTGLYNLDTLVCVDLFENETAAVSRKPAGTTYLIPTAAYTEKAGSATNSGRTLQWRYQATLPLGNTKDDNELLLRFAKAFEDAGAFAHIKAVWDANGITYAGGSVYTQLYGAPYGGYAGSGAGFAGLQGDGELAKVRSLVSDPIAYDTTVGNLKGSEWVADTVYREMCSPVAVGGTMWIYTGAYNAEAAAATGGPFATANIPAAYGPWAVKNRAKSRDRQDPSGQLAFHGWGYSWLVNRRVFYNNGDVPGDIADFYMEPDSCSRLFVASAPPALLNYSRWYRKYHGLADKPSPVVAANTSSPHYAGGTISLAGKFPGHTEPYETPRQDLLLTSSWGRNTKGGSEWDLVPTTTQVAGRDVPAANYPLVLTSIRCVEHFQGGPITRNNSWNVEQEPEPWIELNSVDARTAGVIDGDWVKIVSARTEGLVNKQMPDYGQGFRARVGVGLQTNQRVGPGVVAIPWHWGEKGLSTGSRANDVSIDAGDANSVIPEYKACLVRIEKM